MTSFYDTLKTYDWEDVKQNIMDKSKNDAIAAINNPHRTLDDFMALISPAAEPFLEQMAERARRETSKHFGNTVYLFTPLYIANYCENYCVYCGFNCYNHINRMKLTMEHDHCFQRQRAHDGADRKGNESYCGFRHGRNFDPDRREQRAKFGRIYWRSL